MTTPIETPAEAPRAARPGPIPSLDGLRALAVLIVLVSHAGFGDTVPGGLGVTIFFFLSGYLITTLMLDEHGRSDTVNVRQFYLRRAFRLLPPLLITLAIAYGLVALDLLGGGFSWGGLTSQLFYFANYYEIFFAHPNSIPEGTGILWSLAVEEHFYILFPLLMFVFFRYVKSIRVLIACFCGLCVVALLWRLYLVSQPDFTEIRTYYATDTRFDSILFGCILALWRNPARRPPDAPQRSTMRNVDWLLLAAGVVLLLSTIVYREAQFRESVRYTLQGIALLPIFYYAVRFPNAGPFRVLNLRWLVRIGVLSYGIYLMHFIVLAAVEHSVDVAIPNAIRVLIALAGSAGFAILIDKYVDPYFRRRRAALH